MSRRMEMVGFKKPMVIVKGEVPTAPPGGLVMQVQYAGICHTDVHIWEADLFNHPSFTFPRVLGHEIAGVVHSIGANAICDLKVGERGAVFPWGHCGTCDFCHHDNQYCPKFLGVEEGDPKEQKVYGVWKDGGYQTHCVVDDASLVLRVPERVALDVASLACCSGITAYSAINSLNDSITEALRVKGKANVVLVGAGGLCLWAIQLCRYLHPDNVTVCVVDIHEDKLKDAKEAGAHVTVCWDKDPAKNPEAIAALKAGLRGRFDASVDFTGVPGNTTRLFGACETVATMTIVGLAGGTMPPVNLQDFSLRGIRFQGVYVGNKKSLRDLMDIINKGGVKPPYIEHVKLEDVNTIIQRLAKGTQKGRAVVKLDL